MTGPAIGLAIGPATGLLALDEVDGSDVVLPGSEQLAPAAFGFFALVCLIALVGSLLVRRRRRRRAEGQESTGWVVDADAATAKPSVGPPVFTVAWGVALVVFVALAVATLPPPFRTPEFPAYGRLFPDEAFFYRTSTDLPVHPRSDAMLASMDDAELVAGFGGSEPAGVVWGIPFNPVDDDTPRTSVHIRTYTAKSYKGEYPVTDPAYIESLPTYGFDNHYVALDRAGRSMWELTGTTVWFGRWQAGSGARWDLDDLTFPQQGWSTAATLPLLPGVLSYESIEAGRVDHVVHGGFELVGTEAIWPAQRSDGVSTDPDAPPMGAWLRLRDDVDLDGLAPQARIVAEGLQRYGLVLSDTAGNFALRGTPDARWDLDDLRTLRTLTASDFEVVDPAGIMVAPDSMAAEPPPG